MPFADPEQRRRYQREWLKRRREEWLADKACVECGSTDDLEIHHRDPSAKVTHKVWSWSKARRDAELAKCEVRCAPCHRQHHGEERAPEHGTATKYRNGCRCRACRDAHAAKGRRDRQRRK